MLYEAWICRAKTSNPHKGRLNYRDARGPLRKQKTDGNDLFEKYVSNVSYTKTREHS